MRILPSGMQHFARIINGNKNFENEIFSFVPPIQSRDLILQIFRHNARIHFTEQVSILKMATKIVKVALLWFFQSLAHFGDNGIHVHSFLSVLRDHKLC